MNVPLGKHRAIRPCCGIKIIIRDWAEAAVQAKADFDVVTKMYPGRDVSISIGDVDRVECEDREVVARLMDFLFDVDVSCGY